MVELRGTNSKGGKGNRPKVVWGNKTERDSRQPSAFLKILASDGRRHKVRLRAGAGSGVQLRVHGMKMAEDDATMPMLPRGSRVAKITSCARREEESSVLFWLAVIFLSRKKSGHQAWLLIVQEKSFEISVARLTLHSLKCR